MIAEQATAPETAVVPPPDTRPHVAVVGGGVSGLVAALTLAQQGIRVSVFDRDAELGGRISRVRLAGITLDTGAEAFATRGGTVVEYLRRLGLGAEIVYPAPIGSWVIAAGRAVPLPGGGTLGIPSRPLSRGAVRLLGVRGAVRAACEPLLPRRVGRNAASLASLVRARLGPAVLDRVVRPVTLGVYSTAPEQMTHEAMPALAAAYAESGSLLHAARSVRASTVSAGGAVAGLRGGMGALIDTLHDRAREYGVAFHAGTAVDRVVPCESEGARAASRYELRDAGGDLLATADAVVLAVPRTAAMRLAAAPSDPEPPGASAATTPGIRETADPATAPGVGDVEVVVLVIDDSRLDAAPRGTGVLVAPSPDGAIAAKALTHVTAKWPERAREAGPGRHVLRLSYGRVGDVPPTTGLDDAAAQRLALGDAARILGVPLAASSVVAMRRARWGMSAPGAPVTLPTPATIVPIGDWVSGTGLASVITDAERAAGELVATLREPRESDSGSRPGPGSRPEPASHSGPGPRSAPGSGPGERPEPRTSGGGTRLSPIDPQKDATDMSDTVPHRDQPGRVFRSDGPMDPRPGVIRIGTRGSALALTQTTTVARAIAAATGADVALITVTTHGDVSRAPLAQLGGTGVFVSALRDALLEGRCDVAVHSLKDLPTGPCPGIVIGAIPQRADARDALCARDGLQLASLPSGARVGTGSPRRAAQLLARRPDLDVRDLRGNVDTRLGRVGVDLDAVVLAAAGLDRIGRDAAISERFPLDAVPTAPGQGALAVEVRASALDDPTFVAALSALDDPDTLACATAERTLLGTLEAGCAAPIGAWARIIDGALHLTAAVYRTDGSERLVVTESLPLPDAAPHTVAETLGAEVARTLLARGAAALAPLGGTREES